ncbi:MAG TPA: hypothetical protein V6C65_16955, partial [Allocoleopsis sp.]
MPDIQTSELGVNSSQSRSISTPDPELNLIPIIPVLDLNPSESPSNQDLESSNQRTIFQQISWKRLRGGFLFVVGWLLSPLCWWNDLIFNLPVAYGFGYLCRLFSSELFIPGLIAGYWISNVIG